MKRVNDWTVDDIVNTSDQAFRLMLKNEPTKARSLVNRAQQLARLRRDEAMSYFQEHPNMPIPIGYQRKSERGTKLFHSWADEKFTYTDTKNKNTIYHKWVVASTFLSQKETDLKKWKQQLQGFAENLGKTRFAWGKDRYYMFWRLAQLAAEQADVTSYMYTGNETKKGGERKTGITKKLQQLVNEFMDTHRYRGKYREDLSIEKDRYAQKFLDWALPQIMKDYKKSSKFEYEGLNIGYKPLGKR